jgi:hypothetical protein
MRIPIRLSVFIAECSDGTIILPHMGRIVNTKSFGTVNAEYSVMRNKQFSRIHWYSAVFYSSRTVNYSEHTRQIFAK